MEISLNDGAENAATWRKWRETFEFYLVGSGLDEKTEKVKKSVFLLSIGDEGRKIRKTMTDVIDNPEENQTETTLENLINKFEEHFVGKSSATFERHVFRKMTQTDQKFSLYLTELQTQAAKCNFGDKIDEQICDQIIFGIKENDLRKKLLGSQIDGNLARAINMCKNWETVDDHMSKMKQDESTTGTVHAVKNNGSSYNRGRFRDSRGRGRGRGFGRGSYQPSRGRGKPIGQARTFESEKSSNGQYKCTRCDTLHGYKECPAWNKRCKRCNRLGHFEKCCLTKNVQMVEYREYTQDFEPETIPQVNQQDYEYYTTDVVVSTISRQKSEKVVDNANSEHSGLEWFVSARLGMNKVLVKLKLDTGSMVNILPINVAKNLTNKNLSKSNKILTAYNDQNIDVAGELKLPVQVGNKTGVLNFVIVNQKGSTPILGVNACQDLELVKKVCDVKAECRSDELLSKYSEVFNTKLVGLDLPEYNIKLKHDAEPEQKSARKIPFALEDKVKQELDKMEKDGVVSKVDGVSQWVNPMVIVEKPSGDIRICIDPQGLNRAIITEVFKVPTVEELTSKLSGSKVFAKLDARASFWQVKLDGESAKLTTFSTPFGNYRFNRLPFGLNVSTQAYQRIVTEIFKGIDGVVMYVDDILVYAPDKTILQERLRKVLDACKRYKLRLNKSKCTWEQTEIKYLGFIISGQGVKIDPQKVNAITEISSLTSKEEVHRFLGMLTYVGKFLPNLSTETVLLRELLKKDNEFIWTENHEQCFRKLKQMLVSTPVLKHFDRKEKVTVSCDASQYGLGACLIQGGHPVSFASRTLTKSETNYSQIEKEMLSVVFAAERFHQYVYGNHFIVQNDHKPLKFIFSKPIACCPPRIQRMMLRLQKYRFEYNWVPGKELHIADALSRAPQPARENDKTVELELECQVHMVKSSLPFAESEIDKFKLCVETEAELHLLSNIIMSGWPESQSDLPPSVKEYWNFRDEMAIHDGLIYKGDRILIPKKYRADMLSRIHEGHQGIDKCLSRAISCMFWVGMSKDIKRTVSECEICMKYQRQQTKEPLQVHERPGGPWLKVGCDVFYFSGDEYLLIVDYYSNFFEVRRLRNLSTDETILKTKSIFSCHGIPAFLISDNATNFKSEKFKRFTDSWGITHHTSSPHYPKSNGLAEKYCGIAKSLLAKAKEEGRDPYLAFLNYRDTPILGELSPSQLCMGRKLRTRLPLELNKVLPQKQEGVEILRQKCQQNQKYYYDRTAHPLPTLGAQEPVSMWNKQTKNWQPARVVKRDKMPRSYIVQDSVGNLYRRNRTHLRQSNVPVTLQNNTRPNSLTHTETYTHTHTSQPQETSNMSSPTKSQNPNVLCPSQGTSSQNSMSSHNSKTSVEKSPTPQSHVESPRSTNIRCTSSGRHIKTPIRFSDYNM